MSLTKSLGPLGWQTRFARVLSGGWLVCLALTGLGTREITADEPRDQRGILILDLATQQRRVLHSEAGTYYGTPSFAPDGKQIVFDAWKGEEQNYHQSHLMIMNAEGQQTIDLGPGAMPAWRADGEEIFFHKYEPSGVFRSSLNGQSVKRLANGFSARPWPVDSNHITLFHNSIELFDLAQHSSRKLLDTRERVYYGFAVSPNGKHLAYVQAQGATRVPNQLVVANLDPNEPTGDTKVRWNARDIFINVAWSPDNQSILIATRDGEADRYQLQTVSPTGDTPPTPLAGQEVGVSNVSGVWSPDGKSVLYVCNWQTPQE